MKVTKRKTRKGVINAVYKLLSDEKNWIRGADAIDKYGNAVRYDDPKAEMFCVRGAIKLFAANPKVFTETYNCLSMLTPYQRGLVNVNDVYGYDAVMDILEKGKTECK